ncbi:MAG: hypothetical protein ACP5PJ_08135 [Acidimicrobiales bacterium]
MSRVYILMDSRWAIFVVHLSEDDVAIVFDRCRASAQHRELKLLVVLTQSVYE